jgi:hypothetical protein
MAIAADPNKSSRAIAAACGVAEQFENQLSRTAQLKSESGKTANPVVCQRKSQRRQFRKNSHRSHPTRMQTFPNIPDYVNMIFKGLKPGT